MISQTEALFLGGRSGVGKSRVGLAMHTLLADSGVRHALIEGDYLDMAYPPTWEHGLAEQNLAAMWTNYRALGYRRLIYTNTASVFPEVIGELSAAMGDTPSVTAVLLTCDDRTAGARLAQRENGIELQRHIERSLAMSRELADAVPEWVHVVDTTDRGPAEIAAELIALTGWQADPSAVA
ncbi:ATPase [Nocardia iowensis]|uniref:ATPase n=1 Tax=Nocardia iowensis TaxID=204891 RepID=A0ABX8RYS2_NOCIO|nr:ATPase [Nocardia iowensis]QXN93515.1 ATPase [Nocardia iowensis]